MISRLSTHRSHYRAILCVKNAFLAQGQSIASFSSVKNCAMLQVSQQQIRTLSSLRDFRNKQESTAKSSSSRSSINSDLLAELAKRGDADKFCENLSIMVRSMLLPGHYIRNTLSPHISAILPHVNSSHMKDIFMCLVKLNYSWFKSIEKQLLQSAVETLHRCYSINKASNSRDIVDILLTFPKLNIQLHQLHPNLQQKLLSSIELAIVDSLEAETESNERFMIVYECLSALSKSKVSFKFISANLLNLFHETVAVGRENGLSSMELGFYIFTLRDLNIKWKNLSEAQQVNLITAFVEQLPGSNNDDMTAIMFALELIECPVLTLNDDVTNAIVTQFIENDVKAAQDDAVNGRRLIGVSKFLKALSTSNVHHSSLPQESMSYLIKLLGTFELDSASRLSDVLLSLGNLGYSYSELPQKMLKNINSAVKSLSSKDCRIAELSAICQGYRALMVNEKDQAHYRNLFGSMYQALAALFKDVLAGEFIQRPGEKKGEVLVDVDTAPNVLAKHTAIVIENLVHMQKDLGNSEAFELIEMHEIIDVLFQKLAYETSHVSLEALTQLVQCLSIANVKWNDFSPAAQDAFILTFKKNILKLTPDSFVSIMQHFINMEIPFVSDAESHLSLLSMGINKTFHSYIYGCKEPFGSLEAYCSALRAMSRYIKTHEKMTSSQWEVIYEGLACYKEQYNLDLIEHVTESLRIMSMNRDLVSFDLLRIFEPCIVKELQSDNFGNAAVVMLKTIDIVPWKFDASFVEKGKEIADNFKDICEALIETPVESMSEISRLGKCFQGFVVFAKNISELPETTQQLITAKTNESIDYLMQQIQGVQQMEDELSRDPALEILMDGFIEVLDGLLSLRAVGFHGIGNVTDALFSQINTKNATLTDRQSTVLLFALKLLNVSADSLSPVALENILAMTAASIESTNSQTLTNIEEISAATVGLLLPSASVLNSKHRECVKRIHDSSLKHLNNITRNEAHINRTKKVLETLHGLTMATQ